MSAARPLSRPEDDVAPLCGINPNVLTALAALHLGRRSGAITIAGPTDRRVIHVVAGDMVWADSTHPDELLGNLLAGEGRLDPVLIDPIARASRERGWFFGDQLVADGLFTTEEVCLACERQAILRFSRAVEMPGVVRVVRRPLARIAMRRPIGAMVVSLFRRLSTQTAIDYLDAVAPRPTRAVDASMLEPLGLTAAEFRVARHLLRYQSYSAAFSNGGGADDLVARTAASLVALRLLA